MSKHGVSTVKFMGITYALFTGTLVWKLYKLIPPVQRNAIKTSLTN